MQGGLGFSGKWGNKFSSGGQVFMGLHKNEMDKKKFSIYETDKNKFSIHEMDKN